MVRKNRAIGQAPIKCRRWRTERKKPDRELEKRVLDGRLRPRGDGEQRAAPLIFTRGPWIRVGELKEYVRGGEIAVPNILRMEVFKALCDL